MQKVGFRGKKWDQFSDVVYNFNTDMISLELRAC